MDKDLSRRDFLKLMGAAAGTLAIPPDLLDLGKETETRLTNNELLFSPENIELGRMSHATVNGYEIKVKPKLPQNSEDGTDKTTAASIGDLLSEKTRLLCEQGGFDINQTFGEEGADYALPTIQMFVQNPGYGDRYWMKQAIQQNEDSGLVLPQLAEQLNKKGVGIDQLILFPSKNSEKDSLIIWTFNGELKTGKIKTPKDQNFFTSGGVVTVGDGILQLKTRGQDALHSNLYSAGPELTEIPNSATTSPWEPPPAKFKEYLIDYRQPVTAAAESSDKSTEGFTEVSNAGGVYQVIKNGDRNAVSFWNIKSNAFAKPVVVEERIDKGFPLFHIGGGYFGVVSKPGISPGVPENPGNRPPENITSIRIYGPEGKVKEMVMDSYAASLLAGRYYKPELERNPGKILGMTASYEKKFDATELRDFVTGTIPEALIANGEALGTGNNEILVLICEKYDPLSRKTSIWAEPNPDLVEIPPEKRNPAPQPAPYNEVRA